MRLQKFINEKNEAYSYMLNVIKNYDKKGKIPKINNWIGNVEKSWIRWEKMSGDDPVILTSPFKENDKSITIKIEDDFGEDITTKSVQFQITSDDKNDFNNYIKVMKTIIKKYGDSKYD